MIIEEQAIKLMSESNFKNETHEQFKASLEDKEAFFGFFKDQRQSSKGRLVQK